MNRRRWIALICAIGGLRVMMLAAAFPFFSHIDEGLHYDVILKYAAGTLPTPADDLYEREVARAWTVYGTREYLARPPYDPPPYAHASPERQAKLDSETARITKTRNVEALAPPTYYALAAIWYSAGELFGLRGLPLLYWLRMLSVPLFVALIWLTWRFCIEFHPDRPQIGLAAAALLAVFPQDVFYAINSDVLSPFIMLGAMYLAFRWHRHGGVRLATAAGIVTALAMLTKYSNIAALPMLAAVVLASPRRRQGAIALIAAAIPIAAWLIRCRIIAGDFTGTAEKVQLMGWTQLPFSAALQHPILTVPGVFDFLWRLIVTLWRGELDWHAFSHRLGWADGFYFCATLITFAAAALAIVLRPSDSLRRERPAMLAHMLVVIVSVLFLAALSTRFDFGNCFYPSRGFPYFASGRLILGTLASFAIIYVSGLEALSPTEFRRPIFIALLALTMLVCVVSEAILCREVFASEYNFFHLKPEVP